MDGLRGTHSGAATDCRATHEHGGLGFLPVKDLAAIARLSALASLPDNPHTHSFREAIIEKEGGDLEARLWRASLKARNPEKIKATKKALKSDSAGCP